MALGSIRRTRPGVTAIAMIAAMALLVATSGLTGCSAGCGPTPRTDGETTSTPPGTGPVTSTGPTSPPTGEPASTSLRVYFVLNEKVQAVHRTVPHTDAVLAAALGELFKGPTAQERAADLASVVPDDTSLRSVKVADGIATIDLTKQYESGGGTLSMSLRLAQVVFTATQFPSVKGVLFRLDGKPVTVFGGEGLILDKPATRAMYEYATPPILVESPAWGAPVRSPLRMSGTAQVFEGDFEIRVLDADGTQLAESFTKASAGTGTRGTFSASVPFTKGTPGFGTLRVFVFSAKDGTPQDVLDIPVVMGR